MRNLPAGRREDGCAALAPHGEKLLIHLSNFRPVKRVLDCIRILARVLRAAPATSAHGGRRAGSRARRGAGARTRSVQDHVSFLGKQDHVERLIPLAHVLLMPSEMEAFGLAALEAMACGVPPVGTSAGGVGELITQRRRRVSGGCRRLDAQAARVISVVDRRSAASAAWPRPRARPP